MATTLRLEFEGEQQVNDGLDDINQSFEQLVDSADRVNVELEEQEKKYSDLRQEMRKVEKQSDQSFGKKTGSGAQAGGIGMIGKVAAVGAGLFAMKESIVQARDLIRSMAEQGDQDMQRLNDSLVRMEGSFSNLFATIASSEFVGLENMAENTEFVLDKLNGILQGVSALEVATRRDIENREFILEQVDEQLDKSARMKELAELSLADAKSEAETIRETLASKEKLELSQEELVKLADELLFLERKVTAEAKEQLSVFEERRRREERRAESEAEKDENAFRRRMMIEREEMEERNRARRERRRFIEEQIESEREAAAQRMNAIIRENIARRQRARQAHQERLKQIREEAQARQEALSGRVGQQGGLAEQLLGQQSQQDVLQRMIERRGGSRQDRRDVMKDFRQFMQGPGRGQSPAEFAKFQAEFQAEAKRAFEHNAAETIQHLKESGQITQGQTRALAKATDELIGMKDEQIKQQRDIENIERALQSLANNRRQSRNGSGVR